MWMYEGRPLKRCWTRDVDIVNGQADLGLAATPDLAGTFWI